MYSSGLFIILSMVVFSISLGVSSESFLGLWCAFEINMFSFIGTMIFYESKSSALMKYFIPQTLGSLIFLWSLGGGGAYTHEFIYWGMMVAALLKLGAVPFYLWVVSLSMEISWFVLFWLLTAQKILPYFLFSLFVSGQESIVVILGGFIGALGAWFYKEFKVVLIYYSIFSLSWMLMSGSWEVGMIYLVFFSVSLLPLSYFFEINQGSFESFGPEQYFLSRVSMKEFLMCFLSIVGIPPFLGFLGKILVLTSAMSVFSGMVVIFMLMISLVMVSLLLGGWGVGWFTGGAVLQPQSIKQTYLTSMSVLLLLTWAWLWFLDLHMV